MQSQLSVRTEVLEAQLRRDLARSRSAGAPIRVAVVLWAPNLWSAVETFVRAAQASADVRLDLFCPEGPSGDFHRFFAEHGITPRPESELAAELSDLDIVVIADPYDESRPAGLRSVDMARAGIRLAYLPYAQSLSGDAQNLRRLHNMALHNLAWRIYVANDDQKRNYAEHCEAGDAHVRALGSVKKERLRSSVVLAQQARRIRTALGVKTVMLWNPHWSLGAGGWSTFVQNLGPIMQHYVRNPGHGLILRPHPGLLLNLDELGGAERVAQFRAMCEDLPNVCLDESFDHAPAMLASDAMISDLSSVIPEYLCLNRPVGYLRRPGAEALNRDQAWRERTVEIADEQGLISFLQRPVRARTQRQTGEDVGAGARILNCMVAEFASESGLAQERATSPVPVLG